MLTWFIVGIVFLVIEFLNFGLISIWLACGAFTAMFFYKFNFDTQLYIFIVSSALYLLITRKSAVKYLKGRSKELDRITKQKVKIEKKEFRGEVAIYQVKLDGKFWEAISEDTFEVGATAVVEKIQGNKLILKAI